MSEASYLVSSPVAVELIKAKELATKCNYAVTVLLVLLVYDIGDIS